MADKGEDEIVTPVTKMKEAEKRWNESITRTDPNSAAGRELRKDPSYRRYHNAHIIKNAPIIIDNNSGAPIIKNQNQTLSSIATDSIMENTTLKQETSGPKTEENELSVHPNVTNNYYTNGGSDSGGGASSFGGGTKATESMGLQTQYPIWRRGFG